MIIKLGKVQRLILLTIMGGIVMGTTRSSRRYFKTLSALSKEWRKIGQPSFSRSLKRLAKEKLVEELRLKDGSVKLVLTGAGERQARTLELFGSSIKFKKTDKWDGKWRIVLFDIPEKERKFREILREHLYKLDFYKLQNSVFISPHQCERQIITLVSLYAAEPYVRVITADRIDNEAKLKKFFFKK